MKYLIVGVVVLLVLGGVWFYYKSQISMAPTLDDNSVVESTSVDNSQATATDKDSLVENSANSEEHVVAYDGKSYSPATITIKKKESVTYKNESSQNMWPASSKHPTHKDYPTTGGCLGSTFDACKGIASGQSWSFQFDEVGSWKYHDHLNPKAWGTVVVQ